MALDSSALTATANERLSNICRGKYKTLANVVLQSFNFQTVPVQYYPMYAMVLNKDSYSGATDFAKKIDFNNKLNAVLSSRPTGLNDYGIFTHDANTCYTVIKNFAGAHRLSVLYNNPSASTPKTLTDFLLSLKPTTYYYASTGPFQPDKDGNYTASYDIAMNGSITHYEPNKTTLGRTVQFDNNAPNGNTFTFKDTQVSGTVADGFSTLISFLSPSTGLDKNVNYFTDTGSSYKGLAILAYNSSQDMLFTIIKPHYSYVDLNPIADMLSVLGFDNAVFCDGSDSVFLIDFESPVGNREIVNSLQSAKNSAVTGLKYFYAIKKQP